jgi:ATP-dependent DNA helicase RecQ
MTEKSAVGSAPEPESLRRVLRERFGHGDFRGPQLQAVEAVLQGRDVLLTMPTGAGKSVVYQLPALLLPGVTLVVSPLIALMKDQVDALARKGIPASFVNSTLDAAERRKRLGRAARGELRLLFVTPERFRSKEFLELLPTISVSRLAVDEAHCVSQWGHDFRPDYSRLSEYRKLLGDPPTVATTATATPQVASDIARCLGLRDPLVLRAGIERPNLFLAATSVEFEEQKLPLLAARVAELPGSGIVYSALIRDLERLHDDLARRGVPTLVYHGKLSREERARMQERFMSSPRAVVLATNAFGMGIDRADIRFVLHAQMPRTLEAWTQEVGRAGRDGAPAWCELLYFGEDVAVQQQFVQWANPTREFVVGVYEVLRGWGERLAVKDLSDLQGELLTKNRSDNRLATALKWLEVLGVTEGDFETRDLRLARELDPGELPASVGSPEKLRADLEALLGMVRFASGAERCRRQTLAEHFGLAAGAGPEGPCGACDVCTDPADWRARHFEPPRAAPASASPVEPIRGPGAFARGQWVEVDGRHLGRIVRVEGEGRRTRLFVESAGDLQVRSVDPRRARIVEHGA